MVDRNLRAVHLAASDDSAPQTEESWRAVGLKLQRQRSMWHADGSRMMWEIGDWLVCGEEVVFCKVKRRRVRELAGQLSGYSVHTLAMAASVARNVEPSMRIDGLSWWHHLATAKLSGPVMAEWLCRAAEEGWSVPELRARLATAGLSSARRPTRAATQVVNKLLTFKRSDIDDELAELLGEWWRREMLDSRPA